MMVIGENYEGETKSAMRWNMSSLERVACEALKWTDLLYC